MAWKYTTLAAFQCADKVIGYNLIVIVYPVSRTAMISGDRIFGLFLLGILLLTAGGCAPTADQEPQALPASDATVFQTTVYPQQEQPTPVVILPATQVLPTFTVIVIVPPPTTNPGMPQEENTPAQDPAIVAPNSQDVFPQTTPVLATPVKPIFDRFIEQVKNGNSQQVVGVYVENVLALRVVQQPANQPAFVSSIKGTATQFLLAYTIAGNIGLLAHNYLSGGLFFQLKPGDVVQLVYGDGSVWEYEVGEIQEYQALNPNSPTSNFLNLSSGETLTANDLFNRIYTGSQHVAFQTCIDRENIDTWGRFFVIAPPYQ